MACRRGSISSSTCARTPPEAGKARHGCSPRGPGQGSVMPEPQQDGQPRQPQKPFPVSWDEFHRDSRALAWRLSGAGPFEAIVAVTRGGLVPAAIVARELGIKLIE